MSSNQTECSGCGEIYKGSELESCERYGEDFCDNCLNEDGYCSECEN